MRLLTLLLGGPLVACAASLPPAGAQFDGEYVGQNALISGGGYVCEPATGPLAVAVRGGRFDYPFPVNPPRTAPVPVQVAADGTVAGQIQYGTQDYTVGGLYKNSWVIVRGHIADGTLDATITDDRCTHRLTAHRS